MAVPDGTPLDLKPRSHDVTTGMQKAPARAMLRAVGMTDDEVKVALTPFGQVDAGCQCSQWL